MRQAFASTDTGRVRPNNEDSFSIHSDLGLYLLADGMGGARGGERASRLAVDAVAEAFRAAPGRDGSALVEAMERANDLVLAEANRDSKLEGMGTTLVAALDLGDSFAISSVGDSRAYLFESGRLQAITEDQTWVHDVGRPLGLDEEALSRHSMRHVLTMALGIGTALDVRSYKVQFDAGSMLLLSTDGLHGVVSAREIEMILGENGAGQRTLEDKCEDLIQLARDAGGPDNITVMLIRDI